MSKKKGARQRFKNGKVILDGWESLRFSAF